MFRNSKGAHRKAVTGGDETGCLRVVRRQGATRLDRRDRIIAVYMGHWASRCLVGA